MNLDNLTLEEIERKLFVEYPEMHRLFMLIQEKINEQDEPDGTTYNEGYDDGYADGYEEGYKDGRD